MVPDQRYVDHLAHILAQTGDGLLADARDRATPLFRWTSARLVLGRDVDAAKPLFDKHLGEIAWSDRPNVDLGKCVLLAGAAVLLDRDASDLAATAIARLPTYGPLQENDWHLCQCVLALATLAGDGALEEHWSRACYGVRPDSAAPYTFEMLAITDLSRTRSEPIEIAADATARRIDGDRFYTSAPVVCALHGVARARGTTAPAVLHGRLPRLDQLVFGDGAAPLLKIGPGATAFAAERGGGAALEITVKVTGHGELVPGACDVPPLTHGVFDAINAANERADRSRIAHRAEQQALRDAALLTVGGICRGVLELASDVELSPEHTRRFEDRFMLGFAIAKRHVPGMVARPEFVVRRKPPARK